MVGAAALRQPALVALIILINGWRPVRNIMRRQRTTAHDVSVIDATNVPPQQAVQPVALVTCSRRSAWL